MTGHLIYLGLLGGCLLVTLPLELVLRVRVYARWRRLLAAVLPVAVGFVCWDLYAVGRHQWWYDPGQILGWRPFGRLPVEELLFFLVVPTCAILGFEAVRVVTGWRAGDEPPHR
jgi:lycopene cyclase domain-containing protein